MKFKLLTSREEWEFAYPILIQLRPDLTKSEFLNNQESLLNSGLKLVGAYLDEELVGVATINLYPHIKRGVCAWVHDLVVREGRRNKGIGRELMRFLENWARDNGASRLAVHTLKDKSDSQRFYEKKLSYPLSAYVYYSELGN